MISQRAGVTSVSEPPYIAELFDICEKASYVLTMKACRKEKIWLLR